MIVLLTNDDGIYAEGIQTLGEALLQDEDVDLYFAAPDRERSATGHAITMHRPLRAEEIKFYHNSALKGWSINGTPSDCVKLAVEYLLPQKPDLVISGINRGSNLGTDILYSGTVSAAIEAAILGIPGMAVSLTEHKNPDYRFAANFILRLIKTLHECNMQENTLLNINVPGNSRKDIAGVSITRLGMRQYQNAFQERIDPRGKKYYWLAGEAVDNLDSEAEDTDVWAIDNSYISITPVHFDLTDYNLLREMKKIKWKI
ncbi:MAG TPA: 5'/3'-nucleotidase SurE [Firmicutes bacterium]|jgi:5'-nucleotidase|nr:5'/3'-nucleotidase SurE [Bacillota bacterium]